MKTLIPLAFVLVAIQGVAIILDAWVALRQSRSPDARD
jgi:TRAP-type mannitol/chloroaromatic compound transport system permease small subunit